MKLVSAFLCVTLSACATTGAAWKGEMRAWGSLQSALRDGESQARVTLAEVAGPHVYALGALEGLAGEVTLVDGEVWVTHGHPEHPVTSRGPSSDARATLLFAFEVRRWRELAVERAVAPEELDAFVAARAAEAGLDVSRPFPFLLEGGLVPLELHVIAGECPLRARALGQACDAYELRVRETTGRLLGIFSPDSAGVVCHGGQRTHLHALLESDGGLTGHVERVGLAAGSVLRLPAE